MARKGAGVKNRRKMKKSIVSFVMAALVFAGLLAIEKNALSKEAKVAVVRMTKDVEAGVALTKENVGEYAAEDRMREDWVPVGAFSNLDEVVGCYVSRGIFKNELLTTQNVKAGKELFLDMENPVEVSIKVNDVSQVVGGVLREGDFVDVSMVNGATNKSEELLQKAMVVRAIHADGSPVTREDKNRSAIVINLLIDKKDEVTLNQSLNMGTIRLSKIVGQS